MQGFGINRGFKDITVAELGEMLQQGDLRLVEVRARHGEAEPSGAGVPASHLLPLRKGGSKAAGHPPAYSLRVQSAGYAVTSDLASVVCSPSRMASCFISNVSEVRA